MKNIRLFIVTLCLAALFPVASQAQDTVVAAEESASLVTEIITPLLVKLATEHPWVALVLTGVGMLRLVFKPVMAFLHERVQSSPDKADDERLAKTEASWWFRALAFVLDYTASIKLPPPKKQES